MINSIPDGELFPVCASIMDETLDLIHYRQLAMQAAKRLRPHHVLNEKKIIEDVRERMFALDGADLAYSGKPHFAAYRPSWIIGSPSLFPSSPIVIKANISAALMAGIESVLRLNHMLNKYNLPPKQRAEMAVRGLLIQHHVSEWFRLRYPSIYVSPDNEGLETKYCNHDFKLRITGSDYGIDVSGERGNGTFGAPEKKQKTSIHIHARISGNSVEMVSCVKGKDYIPDVMPWNEIPIRAFVFWLNCKLRGIDSQSIQK